MANLKAVYERPLRTLDDLGAELAFFLRALAWTPKTVVRYKTEILRILAEITLGSGALAVIGGTVGVITAMCFFTGTEVGLQGYAALNQIGTAAFSGFVAGRIVGLQEFGLGLAVAILVDATIVRVLLVPSLMALFGRWNWWLPSRVARVVRVPPSPLKAPTS